MAKAQLIKRLAIVLAGYTTRRALARPTIMKTTHTLPQRLMRMADYTGLDAVADLLREAAAAIQNPPTSTFRIGDRVRKISGSQWCGKVVGTYSTDLTPEGYAVESESERGSVQIYPAKALEIAA